MRFTSSPCAAPDQVEAGRERPQDPAAVAVELVGDVGGSLGAGRDVVGGAHPKMPPLELSVVVVVDTACAVDLADALEHLL